MNRTLAGRKIERNSTDEDFFEYDLRGTDFSGINITNGQFCGALLGKTRSTTLLILLLQTFLITAASYFLTFGNAFAAWFIEVQLKAWNIFSPPLIFAIFIVYSAFFSICAFLSLRHVKWALPCFFASVLIVAGVSAIEAADSVDKQTVTVAIPALNPDADPSTHILSGDQPGAGPRAVDGPAALSGAFVGAGLGTILVLVVVGSIVAGTDQDKSSQVFFLAASFIGTGLAVQHFTSAIGNSIALAGHVELVEPRIMARTIALAGACAGFVFLLFAWYLGRRSIRKEEPDLRFLRHWGIELSSISATKFSNTTLRNCDFSGVDLKHVRFSNVVFVGCNFRNARNGQLAVTRGTPLEPRHVRELVIKGTLVSNNNDFTGLNLQGLDFRFCGQGQLRSANFTDANLNYANFTDCDLSAADLSGANSLGTIFNGCQLTGACIQNWNIDNRTDVTDVRCDFVFTRLTPKIRNTEGEFIRSSPMHGTDRLECNPPNGKFAPGDFTRIYKQLPDTIDFVVKSKIELNAIIKAVESINARPGNARVNIQSITYDKVEEGGVVRFEPDPESDPKQLHMQITEQAHEILQFKEALKSLQGEYETHVNKTESVFHNLGNQVQAMSLSLYSSQAAITNSRSDEAKEHIDRALATHKSVHELFMISNTTGTIKYNDVDVRVLAEEVLRESSPLAVSNSVQLNLTSDSSEMVIVNSDYVYLKHVLFNLVMNGIKYADPSKGDAAMVAIAIGNDPPYILVDVIDNGIGIPAGEREKVWNNKYRGSNARKNILGSGIGLSFVRKTIDQLKDHHITLSYSELLVGSRFRLILPKAIDDPRKYRTELQLDGVYALLVEKEPTVLQSWVTLMEANGANHDAVHSIIELKALLKVGLRSPDIVVTGCSLSDNCTAMDVISALESEDHHNIPVLIIADEIADIGFELQGRAILPYSAGNQELLGEIIRVSVNHGLSV